MKILVPLAEGFEEIEFSTIVDILRRAGMEVTVAGLTEGAISGAHSVRVTPDTLIDEMSADDFDVIVLPGGNPGYTNLGNSEKVLKLVRDMHNRNKYVTAICAAPSVLAKAGVIQGKRATIFPGMEDTLTGAQHSKDRVVIDGRIITSQGPGTAMEFAIKLAEVLAGKNRAEEVAQGVLTKL
ncbi:MAG: DJ-1 family protein [Dehalococcoidales bacterium]|jgi:4-methyl-5(b-hydroxyethyl)-thiazole monophosphate biosynthesis|nr:DJ-1 family protein [Dehalococcoidales bacterium]|tara:strand:+ start:184 stop:729 length:546 start_codon:yes stop_codon:yes gene_type:complete